MKPVLADPGPPAPSPGYIRGGAGHPIDGRRVMRTVIAVLGAALAALVVVLTVAAAGQHARQHRLQQHGVGVPVTVTSCVGTASGTGITNDGFTCRGSFSLNGQRYNDVITGSNQLRARGETLAGVVDPGSPGLLATAQAVRATSASWRAYLAPAILAGLLLLAGTIALYRFRSAGSS